MRYLAEVAEDLGYDYEGEFFDKLDEACQWARVRAAATKHEYKVSKLVEVALFRGRK